MSQLHKHSCAGGISKVWANMRTSGRVRDLKNMRWKSLEEAGTSAHRERTRCWGTRSARITNQGIARSNEEAQGTTLGHRCCCGLRVSRRSCSGAPSLAAVSPTKSPRLAYAAGSRNEYPCNRRASREPHGTMAAPPIGGGSLEITHLLHTGTPVKKGDLVMEFDRASSISSSDKSFGALQAEQEITKAKADAEVTRAR